MDILDKYIVARWCYAIGEPYVDDIEYRYIEEKVKSAYPDNEYLKRSWSDDPCPIGILKKYNLMQYYRDIKFAYKSESIRSINTVPEFERQFGNLKEKSRVSYKLDGFNIQVNYYNGAPISAETRGRTGNSLNANTVLNIVPPKIPILGKVKITGECVIPNDKWEIFKQQCSNVSQRSSVSTCLAQVMCEYLRFIAFNIQSEDEAILDQYNTLIELGFDTPMFMECTDYNSLVRIVDVMGKRVGRYNYPTDGLVIENSQYQLAIRIGAWLENILQSYVVAYDETVGLHSNAMVVKIAPVKNKEGSTYSTVSVTNLQGIIDSDLQIGSPIAFDLRSMTTPVLNTVATEDLHLNWNGRYEEYRKMIDERV